MRSLPGDWVECGPVECDTVQEALSARLDGEREPVPATRVDAHMATCGECADWWQRALAQAAALRLQSVQIAPMFHVELPERKASWRSRFSGWLRAERSRKRDDVELRPPEGARFGRKTGHLRPAEETAE
ncbi:MAG: zf-HC2 domain-containing protein [Segniliparus sp.]|uniref:zf-HC2 domain-containing protein n=1 Tax=Segniliparus sp. TaxID=2804064 RepID=UPI003F40D7B6